VYNAERCRALGVSIDNLTGALFVHAIAAGGTEDGAFELGGADAVGRTSCVDA
jgi:hypothetical protein